MKTIIIIAFLLLTPLHSSDTEVFICGGTGAKKYHYKKDCRGFNACNNKVVKRTIKEAKELGLTLCGWED